MVVEKLRDDGKAEKLAGAQQFTDEGHRDKPGDQAEYGVQREFRSRGAVELRDGERGEVAEVIGVSRSTVDRDWRFARTWLATRLR